MEKESSVEISFVGDICLTHEVEKRSTNKNYKIFDSLPYKADLLVGNIECSIAENGSVYNKSKFANLRALPVVLNSLEGLDVALIANNHIEDYGKEAAERTIELLNESNISSCGYGSDLKSSLKPLLIQKNGITIGLINVCCITTHPNTFSSKTSSGVAPMDFKLIRNVVTEIRNNTDVIMLCPHWGEEYQSYPTIDQMILARRFIDIGVDAIIGCHGHVIQSYERYKGKWIFYGIGNYLFPDIKVTKTDLEGTYQIDKKLSQKEKESLQIILQIKKNNKGCQIPLKEVIPLQFDQNLQPEKSTSSAIKSHLSEINKNTKVGASLYFIRLKLLKDTYYKTIFVHTKFKHFYAYDRVFPVKAGYFKDIINILFPHILL